MNLPEVGTRIVVAGPGTFEAARFYVITRSSDEGSVDFGHNDYAWGGHRLEAYPEAALGSGHADLTGEPIGGIMRPNSDYTDGGLFPEFEICKDQPAWEERSKRKAQESLDDFLARFNDPKVQKWYQRDLPAAKDAQRYETMVKQFAQMDTYDELKKFSFAYITDESYERSDICLAMHTIEWARGWRGC